MPRSANFFVPLRVEGWGGRPPLDLDALGPRRRVLADRPLGEARAGLRRRRRGHRRHRARRLSRALERAQPRARRRRGSASTRTRPTPTGCRSGRARRRRRAPRSSAGAARCAASSATCPRSWPTRTSTRSAAVAGTERTGDGLRIAVRLAGAGDRSWDRTIRADGVVRWVASSSRFDRVGLHAEHPGLLPFADDRGGALLPRPPRGPGAARARAARRARGDRRALHRLRGRRQHARRARGAARARLRPARLRPGHAAAPLRGGRGRARRRDAAWSSPDRAARACRCSSSARATWSPSASARLSSGAAAAVRVVVALLATAGITA